MALFLQDRNPAYPSGVCAKCLKPVFNSQIISIYLVVRTYCAAATKNAGSTGWSRDLCEVAAAEFLVRFIPSHGDEVCYLPNLSADHHLMGSPGKEFPNPVNLEALCLNTDSECLSGMFSYNQKGFRPTQWAAE